MYVSITIYILGLYTIYITGRCMVCVCVCVEYVSELHVAAANPPVMFIALQILLVTMFYTGARL